MGHINPGVYQAYINQRVQVDVESAFLGRHSDVALIKAASHMSRFVNPRAPTKASAEGIAAQVTPDVLALKELRDHLSCEVRRDSGTITAAKFVVDVHFRRLSTYIDHALLRIFNVHKYRRHYGKRR